MTMPGKILEAARRMTEAEVEAAALSDPDAQPLSDVDLARMKRTPQAKIIRRAQGRTEPDQTAKAYLKVIAGDPDGVRNALSGNRRSA